MNKLKLLLAISFITFLSLKSNAQIKIDTIIDKEIYQSYFSDSLKEPLYVKYKLYQAGGNCSRATMKFKNDINTIHCAKQSDYNHSGYDEGHLADAADFSDDCTNEELTFRFYNALPQTPNLNRGIWKHWESFVRSESQRDSLEIICGGIFDLSRNRHTIGNQKIIVPTYCWKIIKNLRTKQIEHVLLFTNIDEAICKEIKLEDLLKLTNYTVYGI